MEKSLLATKHSVAREREFMSRDGGEKGRGRYKEGERKRRGKWRKKRRKEKQVSPCDGNFCREREREKRRVSEGERARERERKGEKRE